MESKKMVVFGVLVVAVFVQCVAAQTRHVVGDSMGWAIPQTGAQEYVTWASTNNFIVGDILTFNFATNAHNVVQVPKASFDSCSSDNSIGSAITAGPANITLTSAGDHYFICTYGTHCQLGQKLAIAVNSAASSPPGASPSPHSAPTPLPPPPPPPTTTNTPPTTPCAPVPEPSPSTTTVGPTASTTPPPPAGSSSSAVVAGFFVSLLSLAMGLLF